MREKWEKDLACLVVCPRCGEKLLSKAQRILSVYDHEPICMACKSKEQKQPDYQETSKKLIEQWMSESEAHYGDLAGYFYHHFNPFSC
jgi:hypothetical protein